MEWAEAASIQGIESMSACMYVCMYLYVCLYVRMSVCVCVRHGRRLRLDSQFTHVCHHSMPPRQASSKAVRSSCELDAWVTTLQAQAFAAAERLSAICEREVSCEYLGQRKGRAPTEKYLQHPSDWKVAAGKERRTVAVCLPRIQALTQMSRFLPRPCQ